MSTLIKTTNAISDDLKSSDKSMREIMDIVSGAVIQCSYDLDSAYAKAQLANLRFSYSRDLDALLIEINNILGIIGSDRYYFSTDRDLLLALASVARSVRSRVSAIQEKAE